MIVYPAIDIRGGRAVRLVQGDYARERIFDPDPLAAAQRWVAQGARALHVVDLDGAREGRRVNAVAIEAICAAVEVPVQVGGGIRDAAAAEALLSRGAARVVLGTAAQRDPGLVEQLIARHGSERIAVGVDARAGAVAVHGWTQRSDAGPAELVGELAGRGARWFVYTPVEVDGTLRGPRTDGLAELAAAGAEQLIYSGGVGTLADLRALAGAGPPLAGAIVGRALYEERFTVAEAQRAVGRCAAV